MALKVNVYFVIAFLFLSSFSVAQEIRFTKGGHLAALTLDGLKEAIDMYQTNDMAALKPLFGKSVVILKPNLPVYLVKYKLGYVYIRFRGMQLKLWTIQEAITND